jgi:hypothetical protein
LARVIEDALTVLKKGTAFKGQTQLAGRPQQELDPQTLLKGVDTPPHHRRRHPIGPGCSRKAALGGHTDKGFDFLEITHLILLVKNHLILLWLLFSLVIE